MNVARCLAPLQSNPHEPVRLFPWATYNIHIDRKWLVRRGPWIIVIEIVYHLVDANSVLGRMDAGIDRLPDFRIGRLGKEDWRDRTRIGRDGEEWVFTDIGVTVSAA